MARSKGRPGNRLNALGKGQTGNDDSKEPPRKRRRTNEGVKLNKQSTKAQKNAKAPNQRVDGNKVKDTKGESIAGLSGQNQVRAIPSILLDHGSLLIYFRKHKKYLKDASSSS